MTAGASYSPEIGDVWRKDGPVGWAKVIGRLWPGMPEYDGGMTGASVKFTSINGNWMRDTWFIAVATPDDFAAKMKANFRYLENAERRGFDHAR